jgi:hypothetical protein
MVDAREAGMTPHVTQLTLRQDGHTAIFSYALSETQGWDVRAEIDKRIVVTRHCGKWRSVEHLYDWLRETLR